MFYRSDITPDFDSISIDDDDFHGEKLKRSIRNLVSRIIEDEKQESPFEHESFVIAINGGWGTGKSWAAAGFVNHLRKQKGYDQHEKCKVLQFELIPFGNVNESIVNILGRIGDELWTNGIQDVRRELKRMAMDATPANELNASMSFFGVSFSKKFNLTNRETDYALSLRKKFIDLSRTGYRFIVVLDDLDRLKPSEVVVIARMVDSLKGLPGLLFIIPFNKGPVSAAIKNELGLDEASSRVYMRKFIKASVSIDLSVEDLKQVFTAEISKYLRGEMQSTSSLFDMSIADLVWYIFLHIAIVDETIVAIDSSDLDPESAVKRHYGKEEASSYLADLQRTLYESIYPGPRYNKKSYPYMTDGKIEFFGKVYEGLADSDNKPSQCRVQLNDLLNEQTLTNYISTDQEVDNVLLSIKRTKDERMPPGLVGRKSTLGSEEKLKGDTNESAYYTTDNSLHREFEKKNKQTVFEVILLPLLAEGKQHEPKITLNYSRRDMQQLASGIAKDPDFNRLAGDDRATLLNVIAIVKERFNEFR